MKHKSAILFDIRKLQIWTPSGDALNTDHMIRKMIFYVSNTQYVKIANGRLYIK